MALTVSLIKSFGVLIFLTLLHGSFSSHGNRICNRTYTTTFQTACAPCAVNTRVRCPGGTLKLTKGSGNSDCYYRIKLGTSSTQVQNIRKIGCRHVCMRRTTELICCQDYLSSTANITTLKRLHRHSCTCDVGYHDDGENCVAEDPCAEEKHRCEIRSSICVYTKPGKYACMCKMGFNKLRKRCRRIDMCRHNGGECDENADCKMLAPLHFRCKCRDGYKGNGRVCYNNLADMIDDLNEHDPELRSTLYYARLMVKQIYDDVLRHEGPFTIFIPTDSAFRKFLQSITINQFLHNKDKARYFLRHHIVIGKWRMEELVNTGEVYNLQGAKLKITSKQNKGNVIHEAGFQNSTNKAKIIKYNLKAANGIIHVVNDSISNIRDVRTKTSKSTLQILKGDKMFHSLYTYIERADMVANFSSENITVFASRNAAWDSLSDDIKEYMKSDEGAENLRLILNNHIVKGYVDIADLVHRKEIRSEAGHNINITVTEEGKVQLGSTAYLHEPDISVQNGLIQIVDGLVLPMPINEILPSKCNYQGVVQVPGPEVFISTEYPRELRCEKHSDIRTDEITCRFTIGGWFNQYKFCRRICNRTAQISECCKGFYGPYCLPCPGGYKRPCSSNGKCFDGSVGNGTCKCDKNYTGDTCDQCADHMFGPNCTIRNGICEDSYPCGENATCTTTSPDAYNCTCNDGYYGDGLVCVAIDPCQTDYGGCDKNISICLYTGPGKHICKIMNGYEKINGSWQMIDLCYYNGSVCDRNADCVMLAPLNFKCTCKQGYGGDGKTCLKNLADLIYSLNENDTDLCNTLYYSNMMIRSHFLDDLRYHGPFTIFLPSDSGLSRIFKNTQEMEHFMRDYTAVKQLLRQHIIVGEYFTRDFRNKEVLYTLQGIKAEVKIKKKGSPTYRYRLYGSSRKANIEKSDIRASNGIIHVVDRALTYNAETRGEKSNSILQLLKTDGSYNRLRSFIRIAGVDTYFNTENITVFASRNSAWDALPRNAMLFFFSKEGKKYFRNLLLHQIVDDVTDVTSLIHKDQIETVAGHKVNITVTKQGQIQLDEMANISQTDIPARNGVFHRIDGLLMPRAIKHLLNSRCDERLIDRVEGICSVCNNKLKYWQLCEEGDVPTNETTGCFIQASPMLRQEGCARICLRTREVSKKCCPGFYGPDCKPCPGGSTTPCLGRGKCSDGLHGDGTCRCYDGFSGDMCDTCSDLYYEVFQKLGFNCSLGKTQPALGA